MRRIAVLAALALVGAVLTAAPAQAAAYGVSLNVSHPKADVGQVIRLSGSVSGKKAAKKTLLLQRRVGSGPWATIARPKTTKKKQYVVNHKVSAVGGQQFRVVAPKKGKTTTGSSPVRAFTGWTWLWLSDQPLVTTGTSWIGTSPAVLGAARPRSIEIKTPSGSMSWRLNGRCDRSDVRLGMIDGTTTSQRLWMRSARSGVVDPPLYSHDTMAGQLVGADHVTAESDFLTVSRDAGTSSIVMVSPRVHCTTARLFDPGVA